MLTDREYAEIRANVMREVRSPAGAGHSLIGRFALAGVAVALVALLFVRRPAEDSRPRLSTPVRPVHIQIAQTGQPRAAVLHTTTAPTSHKKQRHRHRPEVQTVTRMDIQTADPDVRIIWFAR